MGTLNKTWTYDGNAFTRVFQFTDLENNNNKEWRVTFTPDSPGSRYGTWFAQWSRVGATLQTGKPKAGSLQAVLKKINEQVYEDGYDEVLTTAAPTTVKLTSASADVTKFMEWAGMRASESIATYLQGSVNQLAPAQIKTARGVLSQLAQRKDSILVENYYRLIPTKLPARISVSDIVRAFDVNEQGTRLDQLEAAVQLASAPASAQAEILKEAPQSVIDTVTKYVVSTAGQRVKVEQVFLVNTEDVTGYDACPIDNVASLIHGTKPEYVQNIIQQGLRLPASPGGLMFGAGIYGANRAEKSLNYTRDKEGREVLFIFDAKLGRQHIALDAIHGLRKAPDGFDSVYGKAGTTGAYAGSLRMDEFIVYNRAQARLRAVAWVRR